MNWDKRASVVRKNNIQVYNGKFLKVKNEKINHHLHGEAFYRAFDEAFKILYIDLKIIAGACGSIPQETDNVVSVRLTRTVKTRAGQLSYPDGLPVQGAGIQNTFLNTTPLPFPAPILIIQSDIMQTNRGMFPAHDTTTIPIGSTGEIGAGLTISSPTPFDYQDFSHSSMKTPQGARASDPRRSDAGMRCMAKLSSCSDPSSKVR